MRVTSLSVCRFVASETAQLSHGRSSEEEPDSDWNNEDEVLQHLVCIAFVGIDDPVRPGVR